MGEDKSQQNSQAPEKKKTSRFRVALIIFGLVLAALVLKVVLILTAKPTISVDYVAELNRLSKPADYDPNQNAAPDYQKALDVLADMPDEIRWASANWPGDMNEVQLSILRKWLADNDEALLYFKEASAKPYYWVEESYPVNNLSLPPESPPVSELNRLKELFHLVGWHAKLEAANGRDDIAFDDIMAAHRLGLRLAGPGITIHKWVGMSFRASATNTAFAILARQQADPSTFKSFQQILQNQLKGPDCAIDLRPEKLIACDIIQRVFTHDGAGNGHLIPRQIAKWLIPRSCFFLTSRRKEARDEVVMDLKGRRIEYLRFLWISLTGPDRRQTVKRLEEIVAYCEALKLQPPSQLRRRGTDPQRQLELMLHDYCALQPVFRSIDRLTELYHRCRAQEQALVTTVAIMLYKADKGRFPYTLDELVEQGYLAELPNDPYGDGPLVYDNIGGDFVLYSLGQDFDNDGGVGSPWGQHDGDQVFWPVDTNK
ncbi:MAG: hypothetical protein ACYTBJ_21535 [Planctomycetota bacterium]|jgi:hypothetical protein